MDKSLIKLSSFMFLAEMIGIAIFFGMTKVNWTSDLLVMVFGGTCIVLFNITIFILMIVGLTKTNKEKKFIEHY